MRGTIGFEGSARNETGGVPPGADGFSGDTKQESMTEPLAFERPDVAAQPATSDRLGETSGNTPRGSAAVEKMPPAPETELESVTQITQLMVSKAAEINGELTEIRAMHDQQPDYYRDDGNSAKLRLRVESLTVRCNEVESVATRLPDSTDRRSILGAVGEMKNEIKAIATFS